jgi:hypothetical protein
MNGVSCSERKSIAADEIGGRKVQIETAAESLDPLSAGCRYDRQYFAPGRVDFIGEPTGYTGGLVSPTAVPFPSSASIAPIQAAMYFGLDNRKALLLQWHVR